MNDAEFARILGKIDTVEVTVAQTVKRAWRRGFWAGWLSGVIGAEIARYFL